MLKAAIEWRLRVLKQKLWKIYWWHKRVLDFSPKSIVDKISIVVVGRNDNYGGDFTKRLQATIDWNMNILPNSELIYVEWNQIKERDSDCDWITQRYHNSKCFIVPNNIHASVTSNPKMPVMEYFAKNIGIRNSSNDWILLINADVLIGEEVAKRLQKLNPKYVYSTHYINLKWDNNDIKSDFLHDKKNILVEFSAKPKLDGVVGNFILAHKKNWEHITGYDETLTNVRAGVDYNGLMQLLYHGAKPMVIGSHYHLDHNESMIHGNNPTHGSHKFDNIPYKNKYDWGFISYHLEQISERIWELQKN